MVHKFFTEKMAGDVAHHFCVPRFSIQSDWNEVIFGNDEKFWISLAAEGQKTTYEDIFKKGFEDGEVKLMPTGEIEAELLDKNRIKVKHKSSGVEAIFLAPVRRFERIHSKAVRCLDISSSGGLGVSTGDDEKLNVWNTGDGTVRRCLEGHISDIPHCRFFPSGVVILSGGMDMRLKIWSVEDGSNPVTLIGHKAGISDTAIVEKGRNIISCSRDGSSRLWDCGKSSCLSVLSEAGCVINGCALTTPGQNLSLISPEQTPSDREIGTEGKLLVLAREDGILEGRAVYSRGKVFEINCRSSINCCIDLNNYQVAAGCDNGTVYNFDMRNTRSPLHTISCGKAPVLHLASICDGIAVAAGDGSCFFCKPNGNIIDNITFLTGPDCDPVYSISCNKSDIFTACRDKIIRKYDLGFPSETS